MTTMTTTTNTMNEVQKRFYKLYLADPPTYPGNGSRCAYFKGLARQPNIYLRSSVAYAAWKAGKDTPLPDGVTARDIAVMFLPRSISLLC